MKKFLINRFSVNQTISDKKCCFCIGADFIQTDRNKDAFEQGDLERLFGAEVTKYLKEFDLRIFNLEAPLTDSYDKLSKAGGPNIHSSEKSIYAYKELTPLVLSGANNHIYDYREEGIQTTKRLLRENNIMHVGFGENQEEAGDVLYVVVGGIRIGIYSVAENEFTIATDKKGGANGYDPLTTYDVIRNAKGKCDYLIVLFHGGRENYRYPSPNLQRVCRKMVECGGNLIVCQHSHCIGAYEVKGNATIIYGQGNFLFDYANIEAWRTSILLEIIFNGNEGNVYAVPMLNEKGSTFFADVEADDIFNGLLERSEQIKDVEFVKRKWLEFCKTQEDILLIKGIMGIHNRYILGVNRKIFKNILGKIFWGRRCRSLLTLNYLRCESIRESIQTLLEEKAR